MSAWQDLVTASLIGTERAVVPLAAIPGLPQGDTGPADPAELLLDRAALMAVARRAGRRAGHAEPPPACEPDPRPAVGPAAARRLARMLGGDHPDLLAEWLTAAAARGLRPTPQLLPALLEAARAKPGPSGLRCLVAEAGGSRARWLAALNPEWEFVVAATGQAPDTWPPGGTAGPADEPLLEAALDDPAPEVRSRAAYLLASLPGSALGQRMTERALRCVRIEHGIRGTRLAAIPPVESDASMRRDGIAPSLVAGPHPPPHPPSLADRTRFMVEIMARTPLRAWTDAFGRTAAQILAMPAGDWTPVLFVGWSRAAIAQHDRDWAAALIGRALTGWPVSTPPVTEALNRLARRADPSLGAPGAVAEPGPDAPSAARRAVGVLRFRYDMHSELEDDHRDG